MTAISRQITTLVVITLDKCSLTYGVAPCTASGASECYNTWGTCQDRANYARTTTDYKFISADIGDMQFPAPPYVDNVRYLPTKIETKLSVVGRVSVIMLDEQSPDIGVDPYLQNRADPDKTGSFWRKLVARNKNYIGRPIKIYEGEAADAEGAYSLRWAGTLENITIGRNGVTINAVDKLADLQNFNVPDKVKISLNAAITASVTTITLDGHEKPDGTTIDSSGYIRIDDEIIAYTGLDTASNQLTGCTRGEFGTTAAAHDSGTRISVVKYFPPGNPFDIMQQILNDSGIDNTQIDTSGWSYWRDWPKTDIDFSAIITEDDGTTADVLFWELVRILDLHVWQGEDQLIHIRRNIGNEPGRLYTDITDVANIISRSGSVDYNAESRKTRVTMFWGKQPLGKQEETQYYDNIDIAVSADAEGADGYGDIIEDRIFNRWISIRYIQTEIVEAYAENLIRRRLKNIEDARPVVTVSLDMKDSGIETGDNVTLSTDEVLTADGDPVRESYLVTSRNRQGGKIVLTLRQLPRPRFAFIAPSGQPDYDSATQPQREYAYIANSNGDVGVNNDPGYHIW